MDTIHVADVPSCLNDYDNDEHELVIDLKENISDRISVKNKGRPLEDKPFKCEYCQKCFSQASNYKTHLKVHGLGDHLYVCGLCGRDFQYKNSYLIHIATHEDDDDNYVNHPLEKIEKLPCSFCPKRFVFRGDLLRHESSVHTKKVKKTYECLTCHRIFLHQASLRAHYQATSHNILNPHTKSNTISHILQESSEINDAITHRNQNNNQFNVNNNEVFECSICGIQMNDASNLRSHERAIHFGERPHGCEFCGKSFSKRHDLKQHLLTHSPERTFQCTICLKKFKSKKGWLKHKRNFHQDVIKSCLEVTISENDE